MPPRRINRKLLVFVTAPPILLLIIALGADQWVTSRTRAYHSSAVEDLPDAPVGLVLGCSERLPNGRLNLYFLKRMDAAARLFQQGKVKHLLVSGDNGSKDYDETLAMKLALIRRGVPESAITRDHAGFDTLDSVVRSREIFGVDRVIIVSQSFHNARAVYLARHRGQEAWGYDAPDLHGPAARRTRMREKLARVKALVEAHLLKSRPRYLGGKEPIPSLS